MKFVRFQQGDSVRNGILENGHIRAIQGSPFTKNPDITGEAFPRDSVKLLHPCEPSKIVCVGINFSDHAAEFKKGLPKEPIIFLKPPSALLAPDEAIRLPGRSRRVDFEGELGVVIGKKASRIRPEEAGEYIFGYTCVNDVTARDLQKSDWQWARSKGFDTFAPVGPCIETELSPSDLRIESFLNGEARQSASTGDMIFGVPELISFISNVMTLLPGDLIPTGTPAGVGPMKEGDRIEIRIEGIGSLMNTVKND
ncbi:MAG TPA: fumarylacetoacetate hydrolase family protein [Nitrospiria bacterium]|nr:fumarylacetoacetate hydrolase family protein [Nitrospiria bacterium]